MKQPKSSLKPPMQAFADGRHSEIVERIAAPGGTPEDSAALICSLAFLGNVNKARQIWEIKGASLPFGLKARARFALAVAHTRISRFKTAKRFVRANLEDAATFKFPDAFQAAGIYFYYLGYFDKSARFATRALKLSMEIWDVYMQALATDLLGHTSVQRGRRASGLKLLEDAQKLARRGSKYDPFTPEKLIYEAEAGYRPLTIVAELQEALETFGEEYSHTRSNLVLELSRQLTLRGEWREARAWLDAEAPRIYGFENRRQEATLQLRLAHLSFLQGELANARHFLRAARRCLHRIADRIFELRILGLELKVQKQAGSQTEVIEKRIADLSATHPSSINSRIQSRQRGETHHYASEDPLGDLLDLAARDRSAGLKRILQLGLLGLWPEHRGFQPGFLSLTVFENGDWIATTREGVVRSVAPLSVTSRKMLRRLSQGLASKEDLLKSVWGYEYDSLRHDPMIYTALTSLRRSLGVIAVHLQTFDDGWALADLAYAQTGGDLAAKATPSAVKPMAPVLVFDLNWRQIKAIQRLEGRESLERWTVPQFKKAFEVSTMTAWRDLDGLVEKNYLIRLGRGRSTVYVATETWRTK